MKKIVLFLLFTSLVFMLGCDALTGSKEDDGPDATTLVAQGKTALEDERYSEALTAFESALNKNGDNVEAVMYWSILKMASISVSQEMQDFMAAAGVNDYPDNITDMLTQNYDVIDMESSSSYSIINDTVAFAELSTISLPDITISEAYKTQFPNLIEKLNNDYNLAPGIDLQSSVVSSPAYMLTMLSNLSQSYPNGMTAPVQDLVDMLDRNISVIISRLNALSDNDSIDITAEMFTLGDFDPVSSGWPMDEISGEPTTIVIGKAEVLLSLAQLKLTASMINSIASLDFSFPFEELYSTFNPVDGTMKSSESTFADFPENPLGSMLQTSSEADIYLGKAKDYMSGALGDIDQSMGLFLIRDSESPFTVAPKGSFESAWSDEAVETVEFIETVTGKMKGSIDNDTTLVIPGDINNIGFYKNETNWPSTVNWNITSSTFPDSETGFGVNFSALYDQPLFALDSLFAIRTTGEPVFYNSSWNEISTYSASALAADQSAEEMYYLKINDITFGGVLDFGSDSFELDTDLLDKISKMLPGGSTIVETGDSLYVPFITPDMLFSSLNDADTTFTNSSGNERKATGSFWYTLMIGM